MDQQPDDFSGDRRQPPRRDLQSPKSPQLKITKDSHKIKKSAAAPPHRPVIIYEVDPKIHHVDDPSQFMGLVQQLTGPPVSAVTRPTPPSQFERTRLPLDGNNSNITQMSSQQSVSAPGPGSNEAGSSVFMLPASNLSPYIGLDHHQQQYTDYDMTNTDIQGSSDANFIYSDHNFSDYFDDSLFDQPPGHEDP